jgi:hypothetical protein
MNDLFNEYVQALNKALALRKQLVRERMERVLNENEPNKVSKDIVNEIADGANNTFARSIDHYEQHELFEGWEHTLKDGQFIAK